MRLKRRDFRRDGEHKRSLKAALSADDVAAEGRGFLLIMADVRVAYPPLPPRSLTRAEMFQRVKEKKSLAKKSLSTAAKLRSA